MTGVDRELTGQTIDSRYRVGPVLGQGGMGTVYQAEDSQTGRSVAIKILGPHTEQTPEAAKRFEREAFATAHVGHDNCVEILDFGALPDGGLYLVMERLEGRSLANLLETSGPLDSERALRIARHVLRGLAAAHTASIVHRDLKPENVILVERDGDADFAKIVDFGLAKLVDDAGIGHERLTRTGMSIGTPTYMAPERLTSDEVDGRADLYSLSIMLYEMIAGRPPFVSEHLEEVVRMHLQGDPPAISEVAEVEVPHGVEALIRRGMAVDPAERVPSAESYAREISRVLGENDAVTKEKEADGATAVGLGSISGGSDSGTGAAPPAQPAGGAQRGATEIFHGAPVSAAAAAPAPAAAPTRPPSFARRHPVALFAVGAAVLVIVTALIGSDGSSGGAASGMGLDEVIAGWERDGLEPGGFGAIDGTDLGSERCRAGAVSGVDVTLCEYAEPAAARKARDAALELIGEATGAAIATGKVLLVVSDAKGADPSGKTINKLIKSFQSLGR